MKTNCENCGYSGDWYTFKLDGSSGRNSFKIKTKLCDKCFIKLVNPHIAAICKALPKSFHKIKLDNMHTGDRCLNVDKVNI